LKNLYQIISIIKTCAYDYNKAIELDPKNAKFWNDKSSSLCHLERHKEALEASENAIELDPTNASAWSNKGTMLGCLERYEEALKAFNKAIELDPKHIDAWKGKVITINHLRTLAES